MIGRPVANRFADQAGVDLHVAQQEIVLLYALERLATSSVLSGLAFKGGSYLRKMLLGSAGRLSEDLDFTANGLRKDPEVPVSRAFGEEANGVRFRIEDPYRTSRGNWACSVKYSHHWDEGQFQLEISYRERPSLPVESRAPIPQAYFEKLEFTPPPVPCLRVEEALAEKLRAAQQRATERDLFDLTQYAKMKFDERLVRRLAVAKLWNVRERFDPERIVDTLEKGRKGWPDLERLIAMSRRKDWNGECRVAARRFKFLLVLDEFERRLIADHRRHRLAAEMMQKLG
ncbi:MAG TPA: nucleotidyl transferase AbiEii/AbiGii toxin family protein [Thermoplasmata archaeon]|nr:nucleotidyl transferase AbiEii/AbiGii toxin family protein [Thermoplasmata archaeon]